MEYRRRKDVPTYCASGSERLEKLALFLEELPAGSLTFCCWYSRGKGCAVGLAAALNPWFKAQGLRLEGAESAKDCRPIYRNQSDWQAVTAFFALTEDDARALFDRGGYDGEVRPDPRQVAGKIRMHLRCAERVAVPA
jgi:hypothetical protein